MNELNQWEKQLRSWVPRRPSARIKAQLFSAAERRTAEPARGIYWFAPAAACLLLVTLILKSENNPLASSDGEPMIALILSNQSYAVYPSDRSSQVEQNALHRATFTWTNRNVSNSSSGFTPFRMTND